MISVRLRRSQILLVTLSWSRFSRLHLLKMKMSGLNGVSEERWDLPLALHC